jgi:hypothetical protein
MSQEQNKTISGSVYDVYAPTHQDYESSRMPRVGQTVEFEDGRKFVFASTAVDVEIGEVVAQKAGAAVTTSKIQAAGTYKVRLVSAGQTQNSLAGGTVILEDTGTPYKIKSNTASATVEAVDDVTIVTLYDPLVAATTDGAAAVIAYAKTEGVVLGAATLNCVGVAVAQSTAATAGKTYMWVQYQGIGSVVASAAVAGNTIDAAANGLVVAGDGTQQILGQLLISGTAYDSAYLMIDGGC